jgi:pyroglutamyl-peptidase
VSVGSGAGPPTGVLVTGFEPFGAHGVNPSGLIAQELGGVVLPVSYARAADELREALRERDPDVVLCFGLAENRTAVSVERLAHNLDEAATTDNDAAPGSGGEIELGGPLACLSSLPVDAIVAALREEQIPAEVSRDAGGFLCNHVFYVLARTLEPHQRGGFVHVPPLDVLPLDVQLRAARTIAATSSSRA